MKKIWLAFLTLVCAVCVFFGVACKEKSQNSYTLNKTAIEVELFKGYELIAYKDGEIADAVWSVEGETVTVDEGGYVAALAVGNSIVKATLDGEVLTCTVTVVPPSTIPVISFNAANIGMKVGEERTLNLSCLWKGQEEDIPQDITYVSTLPSAVSVSPIEGGGCKLEAKNACENVEIKAQGHWNGVLLTCKAIVSVRANVDIYVSSTAVELYTMEFGDYKTETQVTVTKVIADGETISSPQISWGAEDQNLVSVEQGRIVSMGLPGETKVWAAWTDELGQTHKSYIGVSINVTHIDMTVSEPKELFLNPNDGAAKISVADYQMDLGTDSSVVILRDVTEGEKVKTIAAQLNGAGEVVPVLGELVAGERIFELEKQNYARITFKAIVYSLVIDTKEELLNWQDYTVKGELQSKTTKNMTVKYGWNGSKSKKYDRTFTAWAYDGYVVLGTDIQLNFAWGTNEYGNVVSSILKTDANGVAIDSDIIATEEFCCKYSQSELNNPAIGFMGTFDGRGHTISGGVYGSGGLFGGVGGSGVIKNLAIKDAALFIVTYLDSGLGSDGSLNTNANVEWGENAIIANTFCGKMENCLIDVRYTPKMHGTDKTDKKLDVTGITTENGGATESTLSGITPRYVNNSTIFFSMNGTLKDVVIYNQRISDRKCAVLCGAAIEEDCVQFDNVYVFSNYERPTEKAADLTSASADYDTLTGITRGVGSDVITQTLIDTLTSPVWNITLDARADVGFAFNAQV